MDILNYAVSVVVSLVVGLAGFLGAFKVFDWMSPNLDFPKQLEAGNQAVAIFLAGLFIGLGLLLGSAIQ